MAIPRKEYPRPQCERENWLNLNGKWDFYVDNGSSGREKKVYSNPDEYFNEKISVPFCPESKLSGIARRDFMRCVWYRRKTDINIPTGEKVYLNFGAADWETFVYINGSFAGSHKGGYVSFSLDITPFVSGGQNEIVVCCEDDTRSPLQPTGKQSMLLMSHACDYTRTTGIWQTVWLEYVPEDHIESFRILPDPDNCSVDIDLILTNPGTVSASATFEGRPAGSGETVSTGRHAMLHIDLTEKQLWEVGQGRLYDLELVFGMDVVKSYFGLRSVSLDGYKFLINGKSVFQRLVLDQGFYPDGIYTAPDDNELEADIDRSLACGFNGARLHQKVFEERFLYYCDRKGYIVWGEYPNWGLDHTRPESLFSILPEWLDEIARDFNHPAIIGWCPFNETWDQHGREQCDDVLRMVYLATKAADRTRPCIDTSGNFHVQTDIFDVHDYEQDPEVFKAHYDMLPKEGKLWDSHSDRQQYTPGLPVFISEYGGIQHSEDGSGWGYGSAPKDERDFYRRYRGLTEALLGNPMIFGFCYTQLTDIEQEQNGMYYYDRRPKFDVDKFKKINTKKAAIEDL